MRPKVALITDPRAQAQKMLDVHQHGRFGAFIGGKGGLDEKEATFWRTTKSLKTIDLLSLHCSPNHIVLHLPTGAYEAGIAAREGLKRLC